jgi:hypothetical protein
LGFNSFEHSLCSGQRKTTTPPLSGAMDGTNVVVQPHPAGPAKKQDIPWYILLIRTLLLPFCLLEDLLLRLGYIAKVLLRFAVSIVCFRSDRQSNYEMKLAFVMIIVCTTCYGIKTAITAAFSEADSEEKTPHVVLGYIILARTSGRFCNACLSAILLSSTRMIASAVESLPSQGLLGIEWRRLHVYCAVLMLFSGMVHTFAHVMRIRHEQPDESKGEQAYEVYCLATGLSVFFTLLLLGAPVFFFKISNFIFADYEQETPAPAAAAADANGKRANPSQKIPLLESGERLDSAGTCDMEPHHTQAPPRLSFSSSPLNDMTIQQYLMLPTEQMLQQSKPSWGRKFREFFRLYHRPLAYVYAFVHFLHCFTSSHIVLVALLFFDHCWHSVEISHMEVKLPTSTSAPLELSVVTRTRVPVDYGLYFQLSFRGVLVSLTGVIAPPAEGVSTVIFYINQKSVIADSLLAELKRPGIQAPKLQNNGAYSLTTEQNRLYGPYYSTDYGIRGAKMLIVMVTTESKSVAESVKKFRASNPGYWSHLLVISGSSRGAKCTEDWLTDCLVSYFRSPAPAETREERLCVRKCTLQVVLKFLRTKCFLEKVHLLLCSGRYVRALGEAIEVEPFDQYFRDVRRKVHIESFDYSAGFRGKLASFCTALGKKCP